MKKLKTMKPIESTYQTIKEVLEQARAQSYRTVNFAMVQAYWNIGKIIVEEEQKGKTKADYGKQLIVELAKRLKADFGKRFDQSNLWHMRSFYLAFPIRDAVRRELMWTHWPHAEGDCDCGGKRVMFPNMSKYLYNLKKEV